MRNGHTNGRPLVETADELARRLSGVKPYGYNGCRYLADPPCHRSGSGEPFYFGDHPGGGIAMGCWAGSQGPGFVRRIEDDLELRIRVKLPDGRLTYSGGGNGRPVGWAVTPERLAPAARDDRVSRKPRLYAASLGGGLTLGGLYALPVWFPGDGKKPAHWLDRGGRLRGYRQSVKKDLGESGWRNTGASCPKVFASALGRTARGCWTTAAGYF